MTTLSNQELIILATGSGILAIILATVTSIGRQILRKALDILLDFCFVNKIIHDDQSRRKILQFLKEKCVTVGISEEEIALFENWIVSQERFGSVVKTQKGTRKGLFLYKGRPIWVTHRAGDESDDGDSKPSSKKDTSSVLRAFRWTISWKKFFLELDRFHDNQIQEKKENGMGFEIFDVYGDEGRASVTTAGEHQKPSSDNSEALWEAIAWASSDLLNSKPKAGAIPLLDRMSIGKIHQQVIDDVKFWFKHREWYAERGITWKRGIGLFSGPGCGKTSLIRAIGENLNIPVYLFNLATMTDKSIVAAWEGTGNQPRIYVFEDFDTVFDGRKNVIPGSKLNFQTILNLIDGVSQSDGILLFVTTNHPENFDPAMGLPTDNGTSSRPGRLDAIYELEKLGPDGMLKIAMNIIRDKEIAEEMVEKHRTSTPAQFQEQCMKRAHILLWGVKE